MQTQSNKEAVRMKGMESLRPKLERLRIDRGGEQIDGIPNTARFEDPISTREYCHRHTSRQSAFHASRDRICSDGKPCAYLICCNCEPVNNVPLSRCTKIVRNNLDRYFVRVREYLAEPAYASGRDENGAEPAHRGAGDEAGEQQRESSC